MKPQVKPIMKNFGCMALILVLCLSISSCLGRPPRMKMINHYTPIYAPPRFEGAASLAHTLQVQRFQISPVYNTEKIVFSKGETTRNEYQYERWRSNPRDLVTYFLNRDLRESGLFQGVFPNESLQRASYSVTGTVDEFYEMDGDPRQAVLRISMVLLKTQEPDITRRVIFQKTYATQVPCREQTSISFVEAMGKAMAGLSKQMISDIYANLKE